MLNLKLVTPPTVEPVTLDQAKNHLRVDFDDDDLLILAQISAARQWAERYTGRSFLQQQYVLSLDAFPLHNTHDGRRHHYHLNSAGDFWFRSTAIELPRTPLMHVDSVAFVAPTSTVSAGAGYTLSTYTPATTEYGPLSLVTLDPSLYYVDDSDEPARLCPVPFTFWPYLPLYLPGSVKITFTAGYGAAATALPATIPQAILMLVGHFYQQRSATSQGVTVSNVPLAVNALLDTERLTRFA